MVTAPMIIVTDPNELVVMKAMDVSLKTQPYIQPPIAFGVKKYGCKKTVNFSVKKSKIFGVKNAKILV